MKKTDNLDNRVLNSLRTASKGVKRAIEATADAITGVPASTKTAIIAGAIAAATAGFPADAKAQGAQPVSVSWQAAYTAYANQAESSKVYRQVHPGDQITGPTTTELLTASKLRSCLGIQDIPSLYTLSRSYGVLASQVSASPMTKTADSRVDLGASDRCPVEFGTTPVPLFAYKGRTLDDSLEHLVRGNKGFGFQPHPYFMSADAETQALVLQAMRDAVADLELSDAFAYQRPETRFVAIPHEVFAKGVVVRQSGQYAKAAPAQAEAAAEPAYVAPAPAAPQVKIVKVCDAPGPAPCPGPAPSKVAPVEEAVPVEEAAPAPAAPAPVVPEPVVEQAPAPGPCDDPNFQNSLDGVRDSYEGQMDDHVPVSDIESAADERYDALAEQCPDRNSEIQGARDALADVLSTYAGHLQDRLRFVLADVQAGLHGGADLAFPNTADGHLHLGWSTLEGAENPFHLSLFVNGGNELVTEFDGGERETPFGGALINFGGENYQLRVSFNADWFRQTSAFNTGSVPFSEGPYAIDGGTESVSGERSEDGSSVTTGDPMQNWYTSAETLIDIGQFELQLGAGFGQFMRHEESSSHVYELTNVLQHSEDQGPPASSVDAEVGVETDVNTLTLTNVLTNLLGLRLGGAWNFQAAGGEWLVGADAMYMQDWSRVSGHTETETLVNDLGTHTTIHIDGFDDQVIDTPAQDGEVQSTYDRHGIDDSWQGNLVLRGRVLYNTENMSLAFELGPALRMGSDVDGAEFAPLGVAGNLTAMGQIPQGMTFGANVESNGTELNMDGLFASHADFQYFAGYVSMLNQLRQASLIDDTLRENYISNLFDHLIETSEGFIVMGGPTFNAGEGWEGTSGHVSVGYAHQFPNMGPLGASIQFDSADMGVRGTGYVGLTHGLDLRLTYETREHELGGREHAGYVGLGFHLPQADDE